LTIRAIIREHGISQRAIELWRANGWIDAESREVNSAGQRSPTTYYLEDGPRGFLRIIELQQGRCNRIPKIAAARLEEEARCYRAAADRDPGIMHGAEMATLRDNQLPGMRPPMQIFQDPGNPVPVANTPETALYVRYADPAAGGLH